MSGTNRTKRIYVSEESHSRLTKFAAKRGVRLQETADNIITSHIDEDGNNRECSIMVDEETRELFNLLSSMLDMPETYLVRDMCETMQVLFDPDLRFKDAIRSISEIKKFKE